MHAAVFSAADSVKSALSTQVLEGTVTQWPLRTVTDVRLSDLDESDEEAVSHDCELRWFR